MPLDEIYSLFLESGKVTTDTRNMEPGSIFFALKGENFNGNRFAIQAIEAGCKAAVVDEDVDSRSPAIIKVDNVLIALQQLANRCRKNFSIPFLAITGSNGKTTTKELTRDVLKKNIRVHATSGNLNNHIGVPLTILSIPRDCEFVIIEMGANHAGEISALCEIAEPNFGLITNIGKAHLEGFGGIEGVKKAKTELFNYLNKQGGKILINIDDPNLVQSAKMNSIEYGLMCRDFELRLVDSNPVIAFELKTAGFQSRETKTQLVGAYNMSNIAAAIAVGLHFGVRPEKIVEAISEYVPDNNRSQLKRTDFNTLILDAYNANPSSMEEALNNLANQNHDQKFFIIGDMLELGNEGPAEHEKIFSLAKKLDLAGITVGPIFQKIAGRFSFDSFANNDEAKSFLRSNPIRDSLILVKGSRGIRLEELISEL